MINSLCYNDSIYIPSIDPRPIDRLREPHQFKHSQ